jgi:hypothetical protein
MDNGGQRNFHWSATVTTAAAISAQQPTGEDDAPAWPAKQYTTSIAIAAGESIRPMYETALGGFALRPKRMNGTARINQDNNATSATTIVR